MPDQTARDAVAPIVWRHGWVKQEADDFADAVLAVLGIPPDTPVQDVREALALLDTRYAMEERLSQFQNAAAALIREIDRA